MRKVNSTGSQVKSLKIFTCFPLICLLLLPLVLQRSTQRDYRGKISGRKIEAEKAISGGEKQIEIKAGISSKAEGKTFSDDKGARETTKDINKNTLRFFFVEILYEHNFSHLLKVITILVQDKGIDVMMEICGSPQNGQNNSSS